MRKVIVTGGSRGLGLGICRALHQAGFCVIAIARTMDEQLSSAINDAEAAKPRSFYFVPCDLSELESLPKLVKTLRREHGPIFGLVNNAAASVDGPLALMNDSAMERLVRLNSLSPMILTKYVARTMMADGGGGRIVLITSVAASNGYSGLSVYAATKGSLVGFTHSLARELGPLGININAVAPGFVQTELTRGIGPEALEKIVRRSALNRMTEVEDVANLVEFLLSEKAKSITGTVLTVDAGSTA